MPSSTTTTARRITFPQVSDVNVLKREQGCSMQAAGQLSLLRPCRPQPLSHARLVLLAVAAEGLLTLMDAMIKALSARYPALQIAFLRFGFGLIGAAIYAAWNRPGWPTREATIYNGLRALLIVVVATTFFFALGPPAAGGRHRPELHFAGADRAVRRDAAGRTARLAHSLGARRRICRHAADRRRQPRRRRHEQRSADRRGCGAHIRGRLRIQHHHAAPPRHARSAVADHAVPEPRARRDPGCSRAMGVDAADATPTMRCLRCSARWA